MKFSEALAAAGLSNHNPNTIDDAPDHYNVLMHCDTLEHDYEFAIEFDGETEAASLSTSWIFPERIACGRDKVFHVIRACVARYVEGLPSKAKAIERIYHAPLSDPGLRERLLRSEFRKIKEIIRKSWLDGTNPLEELARYRRPEASVKPSGDCAVDGGVGQ